MFMMMKNLPNQHINPVIFERLEKAKTPKEATRKTS